MRRGQRTFRPHNKDVRHTCLLFHRDLRRQLRIQIHLQFFVSLLLSNAASVLWYTLVHYDLLTNDVMATTVVVRNQVIELLFTIWGPLDLWGPV